MTEQKKNPNKSKEDTRSVRELRVAASRGSQRATDELKRRKKESAK